MTTRFVHACSSPSSVTSLSAKTDSTKRECWWAQPTCGTTTHASPGDADLTWQRIVTSRVFATSRKPLTPGSSCTTESASIAAGRAPDELMSSILSFDLSA